MTLETLAVGHSLYALRHKHTRGLADVNVLLGSIKNTPIKSKDICSFGRRTKMVWKYSLFWVYRCFDIGAFRYYTSRVLQGTAALPCFALMLKVQLLVVFHISVRVPFPFLSCNFFQVCLSLFTWYLSSQKNSILGHIEVYISGTKSHTFTLLLYLFTLFFILQRRRCLCSFVFCQLDMSGHHLGRENLGWEAPPSDQSVAKPAEHFLDR